LRALPLLTTTDNLTSSSSRPSSFVVAAVNDGCPRRCHSPAWTPILPLYRKDAPHLLQHASSSTPALNRLPHPRQCLDPTLTMPSVDGNYAICPGPANTAAPLDSMCTAARPSMKARASSASRHMTPSSFASMPPWPWNPSPAAHGSPRVCVRSRRDKAFPAVPVSFRASRRGLISASTRVGNGQTPTFPQTRSVPEQQASAGVNGARFPRP
jgi:hypothetical protein